LAAALRHDAAAAASVLDLLADLLASRALLPDLAVAIAALLHHGPPAWLAEWRASLGAALALADGPVCTAAAAALLTASERAVRVEVFRTLAAALAGPSEGHSGSKPR